MLTSTIYRLHPKDQKELLRRAKVLPASEALPYTTVFAAGDGCLVAFPISRVLEIDGAICPIGPNGEMAITRYVLMGDEGETLFLGEWPDDLRAAVMNAAQKKSAACGGA
jgi:hypothetical protein